MLERLRPGLSYANVVGTPRTSGPQRPVFFLPPPYRPSATRTFIVGAKELDSEGTFARVDVHADGSVNVLSMYDDDPSTGGGIEWISLEGLAFRV